MIKFENSVAKISFNREASVIEVEWIQTPTSREFREILTKGLGFVQETKVSQWIGDVRHLGAISEEDQQWSTNEWFPEAIVSGIKKMGVIVSDDVFNQLSVEEIMSKVAVVDFSSRYFASRADALSWMQSN